MAKKKQAPKAQNEMQSKKIAGKKITNSTQLFLDIAEIKNDTVILKDGTLRAVMMVSSLNFSLKSEDEQAAVVSSYVSFLNYIDFPIQIVVQSRKLDISNYLNYLKDREKEITNELLRRQIVNYQAYIKELVDLGDIMNKSFFIVVPYSALGDKDRGFFSRVGEVFSPGKVIRLNQNKFDDYRRVLFQRVEHIKMHISSLGLEVVVLDTQSLIELYYNAYNPDLASKQKLAQVEKLNLEEI